MPKPVHRSVTRLPSIKAEAQEFIQGNLSVSRSFWLWGVLFNSAIVVIFFIIPIFFAIPLKRLLFSWSNGQDIFRLISILWMIFYIIVQLGSMFFSGSGFIRHLYKERSKLAFFLLVPAILLIGIGFIPILGAWAIIFYR